MLSKNIGYFLLLAAIISSVGCASIKMRTADNFYEDLAYYDALKNYEYVALTKQYPKAIVNTAKCYRLLNHNKEAGQWYALAMELDNVEPEWQYEYASVLMKNGNYELAKKYLNKYLLVDRNNNLVKDLINSCDSLEHLFYQDTTMFQINALEWNELKSSNFSPQFFKSGIVFVSDRDHQLRTNERNPYTGKNTYDLFFVKLTKFDNWLSPEPLFGNVNGIYNEGPCTFTATEDTMYFTRNNYVDDVPVKNQSNLSTLKIFRSIFKNAEWIIDGELEISSNEYSVAHPTISDNGNFMVFMSDMPWGYGGTDLYWSQKINGKWTTPKNLGDNVNSLENELFPFLQNDSILYFSSKGYQNMGGLDIFYSIRSNGSWSKPKNLGYPINSSMDDFGFIINKENNSGYFNSNREGADMIYEFSRGLAKIDLNLILLDNESKGGLRNVPVTLYNNNKKIKAIHTNNSGEVSLRLKPDMKYTVSTGNKSFYYKELDISTKGIREFKTLNYRLGLDQILLNQPKANYDIQYNAKSDVLKNESEKEVDKLADMMLNNSKLRIEIASHTDSQGSASSNTAITSQRASKLKRYLISKGINSERIIGIGYGESQLVNHCKDGILCLDEEHAENERIEIKVVGFMP